ncbi:hypothetical protein GMO_03210 [Gluconobacter morbifer G707]|uniref:Uncharacterized protein n=1 Tax=Gluconobacter morbifer G707 TaxID=1088869 RepID=G6XFQ6_9PROT|nr:hypothetical protein GMO_03210 [Gluconobacter morbifer G707]
MFFVTIRHSLATPGEYHEEPLTLFMCYWQERNINARI